MFGGRGDRDPYRWCAKSFFNIFREAISMGNSKRLIIFLILVIVLLSFPVIALGETPVPDLETGSISGLPTVSSNGLENLMRKGYNYFFGVMLMIAVGFLVYHKSMLGSPDDQMVAKAKKGVFLGILSLVGLGLIWTVVAFALNFGKSTS